MAGSTIVCPAPMCFLVHGVPRRCTRLGTLVQQVSGKNVRNAMRGPELGAGRSPSTGRPIEPSAKVVNAGGSLWLGDELLQDRTPLLLLIVNECGHFGGGHRARIAAAAGELCLERGVADHFAQVLARLAHDRFGRAD